MTGPDAHLLPDGGGVPNSPLPVLIYRAVAEAMDASSCVALFAGNGWDGAWVDGIYPFHHFHSTAHEALGVVAGRATVVLGGPGGSPFEVAAGDVLVLPAGTGHLNAGATSDLRVAGAYPSGTTWDLRRGDPAEREEVLANIAAVPLPESDPVRGAGGPLVRLWCDAAG